MRTLLLCVAVVLFGCQATEKSQSTRATAASATIESVKGQVEIRRADGEWQRAEPSQLIMAGDEIRTSGDSSLELDMGREAGVLTVHPNSALRIEQLGATSGTGPHATLMLSRGRVTGDTLRKPGATKIVVNTPKGTAKVP
ncbi:MAG TPA: hypothetical protein VF773_11520 [Verrucomicrobiae bacterium]